MESIYFARFLATFLFLALCSSAQAAQDWAAFRQTPAAQRESAPGDLETNVLSRAVFHATNAAREKHGLPPLQYSEKVEKAAALQSRLMRERGSIGHENPKTPKFRTLEQRVEWAGLNYRFIAENVATAFSLQYDSGRPFYKREVQGRTILSYKPDGKPIPRHTYASFASALVDSWMNSPGHRANILHRKAEFLGASCLPELSPSEEMTTFYCTQVFFTPQPRESSSVARRLVQMPQGGLFQNPGTKRELTWKNQSLVTSAAT